MIYESKHRRGERVSLHYHSVYEILYCLGGSGSIILDEREYHVKADQMVLITPRTEHAVYATSRMTLLVLAFGEFLGGFPGADRLVEEAFVDSKYQVLDANSANELRESFRKLLYEQRRMDGFSVLAMRAQLLQIVLTLGRMVVMPQFADSNAYRANRLKHHIDSHYFEQLDASELADMLQLTPRRMNDIFRESYYMTPLQYLSYIRVQKAKEMLLETDMEIISICFEVGFETLSTFYRTFKRRVGCSPQYFRKKSSIRDSE